MLHCMMVLVLIAAVLAGPQPELPARSVEFTERDVVFLDGSTRLAGTVFLPPDAEGRPAVATACPAVVILGGAERGPRTLYKRKLAGFFASKGIAALIYDSPGTGRSAGSARMQTKQDRVREALAAHAFLGEREGIHRGRVGIYGLSEGAGIALLAAAERPEVAFALPVSGGLGIPSLEQSRYRVETMCLEQGLGPEEIQKALVFMEILWALMTGRDVVEWRLIGSKVEQWPGEPWKELIAATKKSRQPLSAEERAEVKAELKRSMDAWESEPWFGAVVVDPAKFERMTAADAGVFFTFLKNGPLARGDWNHDRTEIRTFPGVKCPVLAIWGARDRFVPVNRSAAVLRDCMSGAGNADVTAMTIPGASHILTVPGTDLEFAGGYPKVMTDWIAARFFAAEGR